MSSTNVGMGSGVGNEAGRCSYTYGAVQTNPNMTISPMSKISNSEICQLGVGIHVNGGHCLGASG